MLPHHAATMPPCPAVLQRPRAQSIPKVKLLKSKLLPLSLLPLEGAAVAGGPMLMLGVEPSAPEPRAPAVYVRPSLAMLNSVGAADISLVAGLLPAPLLPVEGAAAAAGGEVLATPSSRRL